MNFEPASELHLGTRLGNVVVGKHGVALTTSSWRGEQTGKRGKAAVGMATGWYVLKQIETGRRPGYCFCLLDARAIREPFWSCVSSTFAYECLSLYALEHSFDFKWTEVILSCTFPWNAVGKCILPCKSLRSFYIGKWRKILQLKHFCNTTFF